MRILTRYILKEVLSHAAIGGAIFTFVLFIRYLPHLLEMIVRNSASLGSIVEIVLFTLPDMLTVTIPMAVLVGILLGLSRLASDSEITAMRASGIGVWSFVRVVSVVAVAGWVISMLNTMVLAPWSASAMRHLEDSLANAQASYEVQPRVFYEDFRDYVLYVQDVRAGSGAANWRGIFLADVTNPNAPKITTADRATVVNGGNQTITMRLRDGIEIATVPDKPDQDTVSTFSQTDLPLQAGSQEDLRLGRSDTPILAMGNRELLTRARRRNGQVYEIEFEKRLAYPAACLVLMLVGVPLGISSRRGGKGAGFVLTIALVHLLFPLLHWHRPGSPEQDSGFPRCLAGQPALCRLRHCPAAANGHRRCGSIRAGVPRQLVSPPRRRIHSVGRSHPPASPPTLDPRPFPPDPRRVRTA